MNIKESIMFCAVSLAALSSCQNDENQGVVDFSPQVFNVSGKVEKGPFVSGSVINIQPLNSQLQALGQYYSSTIVDNAGNFSFGAKTLDSPYAELTANGYFFNEVNGSLSNGTLNLRAVVDLSDSETVNVNILTHLKYQRVLALVSGGKTFAEANQQAQKELLSAFGLQSYATHDASSFGIAQGTDESAALIAVSSLLLYNRSEAELTEYLARLCKEFGDNGTFSDESKAQMKADKNKLLGHLSSIRSNVVERYKGLGIDVDVKELTRFFDWDDDGTAGNEILREGQTVSLGTTSIEVPNEGGTYRVKITSPIPVYFDAPISGGDKFPSISEEYIENLYETNTYSQGISVRKQLDDNTLVLTVAPLDSRKASSTTVSLYDCIGNIVGSIALSQDGNPNATLPKLGNNGEVAISSIAKSLSFALSLYNQTEQYYHYNKEMAWVKQKISDSSSSIYSMWSYFFSAYNYILSIKEADASQLNVYQSYLDVFSALCYYHMIVAWGNMPYYKTKNNPYESVSLQRTDKTTILSELIANLKTAINYLEEKKNNSLGNMNDFFFVSKDMARILLANIYMYEKDYANAEPLLAKVIQNGYYSLNSSVYDATITSGGTEDIFVIEVNGGSRSRTDATIENPKLIPVMNYTEVMLSYAECLLKNNKTAEAQTYLNKVTSAKGLTLSSDILTGIKEARLMTQLFGTSNFAFLKRTGLAQETYGVNEYQLLLPIPLREIQINSYLTQNPGY